MPKFLMTFKIAQNYKIYENLITQKNAPVIICSKIGKLNAEYLKKKSHFIVIAFIFFIIRIFSCNTNLLNYL